MVRKLTKKSGRREKKAEALRSRLYLENWKTAWCRPAPGPS
jgi:hypothetical protein